MDNTRVDNSFNLGGNKIKKTKPGTFGNKNMETKEKIQIGDKVYFTLDPNREIEMTVTRYDSNTMTCVYWNHVTKMIAFTDPVRPQYFEKVIDK
jgi:hypothetical protein